MISGASYADGGGGGGRVVRTLKDGYWDRTELVEHGDGSLRVRKSSKGEAPPGPWGVAALRKEIEYLSTLPARARAAFPPVLAAWDDTSVTPPRVGYEMPFYAEHVDAGTLARTGVLAQAEIDWFQQVLAEVVLERVHAAQEAGGELLSAHITSVVHHALGALEAEPQLAGLIRAASIRLNGRAQAGPRAALAAALGDATLIAALDSGPQVRLHGDLFLENVLLRQSELAKETNVGLPAAGTAGPAIVLIDPVSVAGVVRGPPLFDLVKYESYATGELPALRSDWVEVRGFDGEDEYAYHVPWDRPELQPFRTRDWHTTFRRAFEARYGPVDRRAYRLIDGYFSVAMAANTAGGQRRARLLKATQDFNAARTW